MKGSLSRGTGPGNDGAVYTVDASGHGTVLYSFTCGGDGCKPPAGLIRAPGGNLFGTTPNGGKYGMRLNGSGVVFEIQMQ